jgi:colanic acid/amylovoran biosynthesis glycosyltransferase
LSGEAPSVALFCATYLRPEMLHIHRQIAGLRTYSPLVIAQKLDGCWPAARIECVPRSPLRFVSRGIERLTRRPWQIGRAEAARIAALASGCDLLHIFFGSTAVHLLPVLRRLEVPVVVSFHGSDAAGATAGDGYGPARREVFARSRLVLCRSQPLAARVAALGCDPAKLRTMRTVLPDIAFAAREVPADGAWHIVQAARLVAKKGIATSLRAFAEFRRTHPAARFTVAGEGPLEADLRGVAASLGIADAVAFPGFLGQAALGKLFSSAHIFVHPSETVGGDTEGIPNSLLEAMACGLPAVATIHGGIPEVIADGGTGLLCAERDPAALAHALLRLAADPALSGRLARAGSEFVRREFSAGSRIAAIEALYTEARAGTAPRTRSSAA